ncbi:MAG TPA: transposase [Paraburkholderia sp.]|nr:transposase [Paraburkholderia sp.]
MTPYRDITDEEWLRVAPLLPELRPRSELRGRPLANTRSVLNGVLWVMFSGATWSAMPRKYPSYQTCHRRFKAWHQSGVLKRVLEQLFGAAAHDLCESMEARMRLNVPGTVKEAAAEALAAAVTYTPPQGAPLVSPAFDYARSFKRAA